MKRYDWIVFDSTGTLMIPHPEPSAVYARIGRQHGSRLTDDQVRDHLKAAMQRHFLGDSALRPTDETYERLRWQRIVGDTLVDLQPPATDLAFGELWDHFQRPQHWRPFEDVAPALDALRRGGFRLAVASNFDARLRTLLDGWGMTAYFDRIFISSDLGWSKPNRRFYDAAAEQLGGRDRSRLLMIGDTLHGDVVVPQQAGWHARHADRSVIAGLPELIADLV